MKKKLNLVLLLIIIQKKSLNKINNEKNMKLLKKEFKSIKNSKKNEDSKMMKNPQKKNLIHL